jgi:hypothetical protein
MLFRQAPLQQEALLVHVNPSDLQLAASAACSVMDGNIAPATPAATTFRALRRVRGFASFLASSSNRSALMLSSSHRSCHRQRK